MSRKRRRILVIDDQVGRAGSTEMEDFLLDYRPLDTRYEFVFEDCAVGDGTFSSDRALDAVQDQAPVDLVLLDVKFGSEQDRLGFEILERLRRQHRGLPVVMMSSLRRDVENLSRSLEPGAVAFISKRPTPVDLERQIEDAIRIAQDYSILGEAPAIRSLRREIARVSPYDNVPILVVGERGTGKERVARNVHHNGPRRAGPFIGVNCAGLNAELLESELFGHERGAFTGADRARKGYLEAAAGGSLFLDEIGEIPIKVQVDLLRVLEERSFRPVGASNREIALDVQLISATNADPQQLLTDGRMREDFYDRIAAFVIQTPPLRSYPDDIPELASYFLDQTVPGRRKRFHSDAVAALRAHAWPGNGRELRNVVWRAAIKSADSLLIDIGCLPEEFAQSLPVPGPPPGDGPDQQPAEFRSLPEDPRERANLLSRSVLDLIAADALDTENNAAAIMRDLFPGQADSKRYLGQVAWKLVDWNPRVLGDPDLLRRFRSCDPLWSAFRAYMSSSPMSRRKLWDKLRHWGVDPPDLS